MTTSTPRRHMRSILSIGQEWELRSRAKERTVVRVVQIHRADRTVEVRAGTGERFQVRFSEMRDRWRLVGP